MNWNLGDFGFIGFLKGGTDILTNKQIELPTSM